MTTDQDFTSMAQAGKTAKLDVVHFGPQGDLAAGTPWQHRVDKITEAEFRNKLPDQDRGARDFEKSAGAFYVLVQQKQGTDPDYKHNVSFGKNSIPLFIHAFSEEFINNPAFNLSSDEKRLLSKLTGEVAVLLASQYYLTLEQTKDYEMLSSGSLSISELQWDKDKDEPGQPIKAIIDKLAHGLKELNDPQNPGPGQSANQEIAGVFAGYYYKNYYSADVSKSTYADLEMTKFNTSGYPVPSLAILGTGMQGFVAMKHLPGIRFLFVDDNTFIIDALKAYQEMIEAADVTIIQADISGQSLIDSTSSQYSRVLINHVFHDKSNPSGLFSQESKTSRRRLIDNAVRLLASGGKIVMEEEFDENDFDDADKLKDELNTVAVANNATPDLDTDYNFSTLVVSGTIQSASAPTLPSESKDLGGIDMNSKALDLQTEGEGIKFDMPFDPTQLQNIQIDGFSPVILQIVPTNLPLLLGAQETKKEMEVSSL